VTLKGVSAAASMEDYWMFTVWKSCWGWCSCGVKAKTMTMVMKGCPTAAASPLFLFFCVFPSLPPHFWSLPFSGFYKARESLVMVTASFIMCCN